MTDPPRPRSPIMDKEVTLFPQPDSPTMADDLALIYMKAYMIYADGRPVIARERGRQVFYFK